jgi:hypothetical protein
MSIRATLRKLEDRAGMRGKDLTTIRIMGGMPAPRGAETASHSGHGSANYVLTRAPDETEEDFVARAESDARAHRSKSVIIGGLPEPEA